MSLIIRVAEHPLGFEVTVQYKRKKKKIYRGSNNTWICTSSPKETVSEDMTQLLSLAQETYCQEKKV